MAKSSKKKKNSSKKYSIAVGIIFAVVIICVIGFFVYISGILPKTVRGMKVTETVDGNTTTIASASVSELNYHYYQVLNTYNQYGYLTDINLDDVADESTGKTYYQIILDNAADELMNSILVNNAAEADTGFSDNGGAARYASMSADSVDSVAENYGYSSPDTYLQYLYGTGFSLRSYKNACERQALTEMYQNYLKQYAFMPADSAIEDAYEISPEQYERADFNYYFFAADTDEDGNVTDLDAAQEKAQAVIDAATDSDSFRAAVLDQLSESADTTAFDDDANPTYCDKYTYATVQSISQDVADFLFGRDTEDGAVTVIENDDGTGYYAVLLGSRYLLEDTTVSYRTLTLNNDVASDENATAEEIAAGIADVQNQANSLLAQVTDSSSFTALVEQNSDSASEILDGGYTDGVTMDDYQASDDNPLSANDLELSTWLFDDARATGDTLIQTSDDNSSVTIYFFEESDPSWVNTAKQMLITSSVNAWSDSLTTTNEPAYVVFYNTVSMLSY